MIAPIVSTISVSTIERPDSFALVTAGVGWIFLSLNFTSISLSVLRLVARIEIDRAVACAMAVPARKPAQNLGVIKSFADSIVQIDTFSDTRRKEFTYRRLSLDEIRHASLVAAKLGLVARLPDLLY
jgi:hypothetical protein